MIESDSIAHAERDLGRMLAAYRRAAGYNQTQFAPFTGYSRSTLANVETGRQSAPRDFWERCDSKLGTGRVLVGKHEEINARLRWNAPSTAAAACPRPGASSSPRISSAAAGSPSASMARR
jgi:DNA-binding XRE family transcriptional regulator